MSRRSGCAAIFLPLAAVVVRGLQIPVLFESKNILIVNKPTGIAHHEDPFGQTPGILQLIRQQRQESYNETNETSNTSRLWGVHRLDKVTSGILVLAKDQKTASTLSKFFAEGKIKKIYVGLSSKKPKKKKQGWVNGEMVRSRREAWMLTRTKEKDSTNFAKTRFFTASMNTDTDASSSPSEVLNGPKTVIMFVPHTGKTHQLRVAAKAMGVALMGDPLYSDGSATPESRDDDQANSRSVPRTMLHASGISIPPLNDNDDDDDDDDDDGEPISVWCEPPFFEEQDDNVASEEAAVFHRAVETLMNKHCEESGIMNAMLASSETETVADIGG